MEDRRPDQIDKMVYTGTHRVRNMYYEACERLGLTPTTLTPIVIMQRTVR